MRASLLAVYLPEAHISGPYPETLCKWDALLGYRRTPILCASDAHGTTYHLGPLSRVLFPYEHLFRAVNMHILTQEPFNGQLAHDAALVYQALAQGSGFVAYDAIGSARGFRFYARNGTGEATMGEELRAQGQVELMVSTPLPAGIRLLHNGNLVAERKGRQLRCVVDQPGAYRVVAYRTCWLRTRGWIFSNPVYVTSL